MQQRQSTSRALRRRLLARASVLAMRVALRPRGWTAGVLAAAGLIGANAPALAQEVIDLATGADLVLQGGGRSVSGAGDLNEDGVDDVIIGAVNATYVVFGSEGLPNNIDLATDADVVIQGAGYSVSGAGDVNDDGVDDVIIGVPFADPNGRESAGANYVVFGGQNLPNFIDLATEADVVIEGGAAGDFSGRSVSAAGDVNGDDIDDLIVGAPSADRPCVSGDSCPDLGASYVIFGRAQGLPATIDLATGADVEVRGVGYGVGGDQSG